MKPTLLLAASIVLGALPACSGSNGLEIATRFNSVQLLEAGETYTQPIQVTGADSTPSFSLLDGPVGMTIDSSGVVSWEPTLGGFFVQVEARDNDEAVTAGWYVRVHQGVRMGTAYSPRGFESNTTTQGTTSYLTDRRFGRVVGYHTNWRDAGATTGEVPGFFNSAVAARTQFGVEPTFVTGWADGNGLADLTSGNEPGNNTWSNAETRAEFKAMATAFAQSAQPSHLALANEFNIWWASNQSSYGDWESLYIETYDAIKAVSPNTKVFVTFQLEFLKDEAATTGWAGGDTWACFDLMVATGKLDVAAFTSYPYFGASTPAAIASDHYGEIQAHWSAGPVVFTEIGWLSAPSGPYPGSFADQAAFVDRFFGLTDGLDLDVVQWLFAYDFDGEAMFPPFVGVGLRSNDGSVVRTVDQAWRDAVALREIPILYSL